MAATTEPDTPSASTKTTPQVLTSQVFDPIRDLPSSTAPTKKLPTTRASTAANSPSPSRESSPVRPSLKVNPAARSSASSRSRKNSAVDTSPSRSSSSTNPPSAAATQRALSASATPTLHPVASEPPLRVPVPQKPSLAPEAKDTPRWPISPRLRSPPPVKPSILSPRKAEHELPPIDVLRTPQAGEQQEGRKPADQEADDLLLPVPGMRTPARGASGSTLETVQETSQPDTPSGHGLNGAVEKIASTSTAADPEDSTDNASNKTIKAQPNTPANESGSESGGRGEIKMRATSAAVPAHLRPSNGPATKSYPTNPGRAKIAGEGSTSNMTVETETVNSIPQVAIGTGVPHNNGSIRTKPSAETIRPKKEKKKMSRKAKAPSVTGTASSKADIFEAKVASAVDEANSSDSEETFVYESNPPDVSDRPRRFHSRTPSATSMASQVDQRNGLRSIADGQHSVAMKKSMKFANSYSSNGQDATGDEDGRGTARSSMGTGRGTTQHHHIGGRWNRPGGNGHPSLFDNESPFPNAAKSKMAGNGARHSSRPTSPKVANMRMVGNGKRSSPITSSSYDLDDGADDERTPLISSTLRSSRSARSRRPGNPSARHLEHQALRHDRSFTARFAGCFVLTCMLILVVMGAIGFMFATTQPLSSVKVVALKNVLASEQDVILDLKVQAHNPNLVVVTIDSTDLIVFAKSKYAGTDMEWWKHTTRSLRRAFRIQDDDPNDPPTGQDPNADPNMEIGRVLEFDSPLIFEGSPFHNEPSYSLGQIRIKHPGNDTLPSGSERWGRVLQHEFDLIVRGTLKYTLPLSQNTKSISVEGRVLVKPNAADQDPELLKPLQ